MQSAVLFSAVPLPFSLPPSPKNVRRPLCIGFIMRNLSGFPEYSTQFLMRHKCKHTHTTNHKQKQILGQRCEAQTSFGIRQVVHLFKVTTHGPDNKTSSEDILEVEQKEKKHDQHRLFSAANMNRRNVFSNVNLMIFKL